MSAATYFWSGSNRAGEIFALARHRQHIGVAVDALDKAGRALKALLALAPASRVVVNVARARGKMPILMFNRERVAHASLPTGDVPVRVKDGGEVLLGFRKIACNVARRTTGGDNVLATVLREIFGDRAGERGAGHKVVLELTPKGWTMSDAEIADIAASDSKVFVDSGAFGEVRFDPSTGKLVDHRPLTHADWLERLAAYDRIAAALGPRAFLVAPDKVGDQEETLCRLRRYADRLRSLRSTGANIIVPIQRGALDGATFDRACTEILGFGDYVRGIPSKKAAASVSEIAALSRSLPSDARVHLLGLGPFGDRYDDVIEAIGRPAELVSCDSVRIKALVGRTNGRGEKPRILTELTDMAKRMLGLVGKRLSATESDSVKYFALDRYFSDHYQPRTMARQTVMFA